MTPQPIDCSTTETTDKSGCRPLVRTRATHAADASDTGHRACCRCDYMRFSYTFRLIITASDFIVNTAGDWILLLTVIKLTHEKEAIDARTVRRR
ncbi:hypothetical protein DVP62_09525 [Yersinia enterocolitica]|nr:hypothetical protein [Yersinia enterocolitica]EKN6358299.1 hypothetical protein [Yersinia enterocolitica]